MSENKKVSMDYNRIMSMGIEDGANREGEICPDCGAVAELKICEVCGVQAWIIDCGHYTQPRPLAADEYGHIMCEDCYEERKDDMDDITEEEDVKTGYVGLHMTAIGNRGWYSLSSRVYITHEAAEADCGYLTVTRRDDGVWVVDDTSEARAGVPQGARIGTSGYLEEEGSE